MIKSNTRNYSKEWQKYKGYDKFEYDIKLHDGTIIENCYPNANIFMGFGKDKRDTASHFVSEIRFANNPIIGITEPEL